jgi:ArsR family transcriptional regulator
MVQVFAGILRDFAPCCGIFGIFFRTPADHDEIVLVISVFDDMFFGVKDMVLAAKAFADPSRIRILVALRKGELCVCELCDALGVTQSTLSTHLQIIRKAGLVSARKQGKWMYYAVTPQAKRLADFLFLFYSDSLKNDATLRRDEKKLARRLVLRDNGACCIGFGRKGQI